MIVRLLCGPDAGEVRNLPFLAARGVLRTGVAELVPEQPESDTIEAEAPPPRVEVTSFGTETPAVLHGTERVAVPYNHHKRPGRRR